MTKDHDPQLEQPGLFIDQYRLISPRFNKALGLAQEVHKGQKRVSGEEYIEHPKAVSQIILDWYNGFSPDEELMCASPLHDAVEDHPYLDKTEALKQIVVHIGETEGSLVDGVSQFRADGKSQSDDEYLQKQAAAGFNDVRVYLLKLADRLHNMRTLYAMPPEKQTKKAIETYTFANLAERLGMWVVKRELEDLSFLYEQPEKFKSIKHEVDNDPRLNPEFITKTQSLLEDLLQKSGIKGLVIPRQNGYFSLFQKREKMLMQGKGRSDTFWHVNDLISFRVVVDTQNMDETSILYSLLGQISNHPDLNMHLDLTRFDDYLADPQPNLYSAIHQTFNFDEGATEIAITTAEREEFNNWGIMYLMRRGKLEEASERYDLKIVFDTRGKPIFLPRNATGVDFVYSINPRLGTTAESLIIEGQETDLTLPIPAASVITIKRKNEPNRTPPTEFLDHCSDETRLLIEQQFTLLATEFEIEKGRNIIEPLLAEVGLLDAEDWPKVGQALTTHFEVPSLTGVYFKVGRSGPEIQSRIRSIFREEQISKERLGLTTIRVRGKNRPNVLRDLTALISSENQGLPPNLQADIKHLRTSEPITGENDSYELRIVLEDKAGIVLNKVKSAILDDDRFDHVTIV